MSYNEFNRKEAMARIKFEGEAKGKLMSSGVSYECECGFKTGSTKKIWAHMGGKVHEVVLTCSELKALRVVEKGTDFFRVSYGNELTERFLEMGLMTVSSESYELTPNGRKILESSNGLR